MYLALHEYLGNNQLKLLNLSLRTAILKIGELEHHYQSFTRSPIGNVRSLLIKFHQRGRSALIIMCAREYRFMLQQNVAENFTIHISITIWVSSYRAYLGSGTRLLKFRI